MTTGETIASLRKEHGFSQAELAKRIGHTRGHVVHLERDDYPPTPDDAKRLARELEVTPAEITEGGAP